MTSHSLIQVLVWFTHVPVAPSSPTPLRNPNSWPIRPGAWKSG